ncbi:hypothetical protein Geob_3684 [Geotalea daltonii FRC-32]|uniref:Uncharacterized protein n=1 Tax=Geotalea daltonii (strain DSM 22248 / JCM 15807 / FRC-32) TaxID=316067 RepID=B9M702_GEODF|nr:MXAN_5187 C-terminal domain-containing protein [Geotalea daltonii]ACM22023.1 hypothetical protein Geob_3684 [Geotalea daltonii FRC-32]
MGIPEDLLFFEQSLHDLVTKYEQFFLGLEKREPLKLLDTVERACRKYANTNISNTMLKFRYNSLVASFNTHKQKWTRINRLIEEGKYSRDRFKMAMHSEHPDKKQPREAKGDTKVNELYREFVEARKACNLPTSSITPDMISAAIEKQKPLISSKYNCNSVEFKVVIEDGKPKIKARPKQ